MTDPFALASKLLDLVVSGFDAAGVSLPGSDGDTEGIQYVAPGQTVAYDGPQITTNVLRIYPGQPGSETPSRDPRQPMVYSCDLQVVILRTTPVQDESGDPPSVKDLQDNAAENINDLTTLREVLSDVVRTHQLVEQGGTVTLPAPTTLGPQGGLVGVAATISVELL